MVVVVVGAGARERVRIALFCSEENINLKQENFV